MKKILLSFMTIVVFALIGCNASAEDISEISSLAEEISAPTLTSPVICIGRRRKL